jgi:rhomboid protease GluP
MNHAHEPPRSLPALPPAAAHGFVGIGVSSAPPPPLPPPLDEAPQEFVGLTALSPVTTERKARDHALVLQSMSIWHIIRRSYLGWVLLVRSEDYERAAQSIDNYETENRDWPPRPARERPRHAPSMVVPLSFAALALFFFLVTGPVILNSRWFVEGTAISTPVLSSEPFRAVTALTLHADSMHVLGNAVSGTIFTTAVQRRLGAGAAVLTVLASGILGNVANALFHKFIGAGDHHSIGASTAVFGAVGLLAATQLVIARPAPSGAKRPWTDIVAPLLGGLALLGALGSGSDAEGARVRGSRAAGEPPSRAHGRDRRRHPEPRAAGGPRRRRRGDRHRIVGARAPSLNGVERRCPTLHNVERR